MQLKLTILHVHVQVIRVGQAQSQRFDDSHRFDDSQVLAYPATITWPHSINKTQTLVNFPFTGCRTRR